MHAESPEYICCNQCGADTPQLLFAAPAQPQCPARPLGVVRCRACGLVYRNIRPNAKELSGYYGQWEAANLSPAMMAGRTEVFDAILRRLAPFRRNNRVLDVGAGHGFFLRACADRGWEGNGVEPSRRAVDYARQQLGLSLTCGTFEEAAYPAGHFDAVTFINVLEFLPDPKGALRKAQALLRPGGVVAVRFSNATFHVAAFKLFRFLGRVHRRLNLVDLAVIHLYAFDANSITRLLLESGFTEAKVSSLPLSWITNNKLRIMGLAKRSACKLLYLSAVFFSLVSFGRLMIAPSLVVVARKAKEADNPAGFQVEELQAPQRAEWNAFVGQEMHGHFFQSWEWGDLKQKLGWRPVRLAVRQAGRIIAAVQLLELKAPLLPLSILYAPRGPVVDYNDKRGFACLLSAIVALAKRKHAIFLQIDPALPKTNVQATSCLAENGFVAHLKYGVIGMTLPTRVFRLNVRQADQELLARMGPKHRQYIRLGKKKGISIVQDNSTRGLATFYAILQETSRRKKFIIHSYSYLQALFDQFAPQENIKLFFAIYQGKPVAAKLVVAFGDTCWGMYAGMLDAYQHLRLSYLLTWEILRWARENGYSWFDFRGAGNPDPASDTHGIYQFKKGFGPEYVEFIGEYYLVFSRLGFQAWNLVKVLLRYASKSLRALHALRCRLKLMA